MSSILEAAQNACAEIGVIFRQVPADGDFHYLDVMDKAPRNRAGRIKLFADGEGGRVWNHVTTEDRLFWAKDTQVLSPADRAARKHRIEKEREESDRRFAAEREQAALVAIDVFSMAQPISGANPYLSRKMVEPTETLRDIALEVLVRTVGYHPQVKGEPIAGERILIVPVTDGKGLTTIEMIDETGRKPALKSGRKKGCFWSTGWLPDGEGEGLRIGIGEGVATVLSYHAAYGGLGVAALSCGNLKAVAEHFCTRYPLASVTIIADIGNGQAQAVEAARCTGSRLLTPTFPDGSTGSDLNDVHVQFGISAVRKSVDSAALVTLPAETTPGKKVDVLPISPLPLLRAVQKNDPFPIESLPPVIQAAAKRVREVVQAPMELICQSFLAAATLAVQPFVDVMIDGRRFPVSNNFIAVGISGERKSAVDTIATGPIKKRQEEQTQIYYANFSKHEAALVAWENRRKAASKEQDPDVLEALMYQAGERPKLLQPCEIVSDPSFQGIEKFFAEGHFTLGLFSDEGGKFLGGFAMAKENQTNTITGLSKLWDGGPLDRLRGGDGLSLLYGRRFSVHLMLQPVLAGELFGNRKMSGQGFLSRSLCCWPDSTIGTREYLEVDLTEDVSIQQYNAAMTAILNTPIPRHDREEMGLAPRALTLSARAKEAWIGFYRHVEPLQLPGGDLAPITGFASKVAEHAARIAGVLATFNDPATAEIGFESMAGGISIAQFYLGEALRLFHSSNDDPFLILAEECFSYGMLKTGGVIGLRNLYQFGPNAVRDKQTATRIMQVLTDHNRAVKLPAGAVVDGKNNRDAWQLVPLEG